jgi:hypothetical protein
MVKNSFFVADASAIEAAPRHSAQETLTEGEGSVQLTSFRYLIWFSSFTF